MITLPNMDTFNLDEFSSIAACRLTGSSAQVKTQVKTNAQETENRAQ
jgi:hypothetical protein